MKRLFYLLLAAPLCLLLIFAAGCSQENGAEPMNDSGNTVNPDISLSLDSESYPVGTAELIYTLGNSGDTEYWYGVDYLIEKNENGEWIALPYFDELAWIEIAKQLPANGESSETVNLAAIEPALEPGQYRLVKTVEGCKLSAEFEIVPAED